MNRFEFVLVLMLGIHGTANATDWTIADLGTLGGSYSTAAGLNNLGQVVGSSTTAAGAQHAFEWQAGTITDLGTLPGGSDSSSAFGINDAGTIVGAAGPVPGLFSVNAVSWTGGSISNLGTPYVYSEAHAINNAGQIVGESDPNGSGPRYAAMWQSGTITNLDTVPGHDISQASAINGSGQVAGMGGNLGAPVRALLWQGGATFDLGTLPGTDSANAFGINDGGQIVGASGGTAFLWESGNMVNLGGFISEAHAINNHGRIVGTSGYLAGSFDQHAFMWDGGQMIDLSTLPAAESAGWVLTSANAVNDLGQIVGTGMINGEQHGFLLTPVPEPQSCALLLSGLTIAGLRIARSRAAKGVYSTNRAQA